MTPLRRISGHAARLAVVGSMVAAGLSIAAAPASANTSGFGGPVGVTQTVTVTNTTPSGLGQSTCNVQPTINGALQPAATGALINGTLTFQWTPQIVGAATFSASDCTFATPPPAASITQVNTTTVISTPNTAPLNQATKVLVTVPSASPSAYTPTGQVVVRNANGAVLQTMGLTPGPGVGQSFAYFWWTPTVAGTFFFIATYNGDNNARTSVSPQDTIIATPSGGTISLTAPATMTQGVPVQLIATVFPTGTQGSVGFTVNGTPISASIPIAANGQASFLWTPTVAGQITLGASYTTNQGGSGSTSSRVTVVPGPAQQDVISLVQPGVGPWNPNGVYTLPNGTTFTFQASTRSGAAVTLTETGPCQVSGLTLVVDTGSGQCNIVASSQGGPGYAPVQQGYTVLAAPGTQALTFQPPRAGRVNKGRTLRLEAPGGSKTTAGQTINWRVTSGSRNCQLRFPSNGAVNLRTVRTGDCNVRGIADAVPGQWNRMVVNFTYRVR
jgi:hypothetical protein